MRPVHIIGMGMILGATALGAMLAIMTLRWQSGAYPERIAAVAQSSVQSGAAQGTQAYAHDAAAGDTSQGKALFESKCAGCHSIGGGKGVGPDLKGVAQRRSNDWLMAFITAPDQVIARGDPAATEMVKEYGMPMPNLGITMAQADEIIKYLRQ